MFTFTRTKTLEYAVTPIQVADALSDLLEMGKPYAEWLQHWEYAHQDFLGGKKFEAPAYADPEFYKQPSDTRLMIWVIENPSNEDEVIHLDITPAKIEEGLGKMLDAAPNHFNDLMTDNADMVTMTVLAQFIAYGEEVYG